MDTGHLDVSAFLPHTRRMKLVSRMPFATDSESEVEFAVKPESPFLDEDGYFKGTWLVEILAQAVACCASWIWQKDHGRDRTPVGYVVSFDRAEVGSDFSPMPGEVLLVKVKKEFEMPPAAVFLCELYWKGQKMAWANLKTFVETKAEN
jgi:predicted hotdog family 3-hydroxylacyl-ACP dehydratase